MTNQDRIEKIKENNKELLNRSREEQNNSSKEFQTIVNKVIEEIKTHANNSRKINTFNKINELLISLSNEINSCNDVEKIKALRNKLNYYITKVRKELEKREFITLSLNKYKDLSLEYRKSIAKNIRYLKRQTNIDELDRLNSNYDNLNEEELVGFKKLLKKEQDYNSRNLKVYKELDKKKEFFNITNLQVNKETAKKVVEENLHEKVKTDVDEIRQRYKLNPLPVYDKSVGANIFTLVKNIPTYLKNKRIIFCINREDESFDQDVLNGFIEYNRRRNSIRLTLREILNPKYRNNVESLYLSNDNYCSYWIKNVYNSSYAKALRM